MIRALFLCLTFALPAALPAQAQEGPNRMAPVPTPPGPVARCAVAARLLAQGLAAEDPVTVLTAWQLARGVTLRPATGWTADPAPLALPEAQPGLPRDPGGEAAARLLDLMVEGDADLRILAEEGRARRKGASGAASVQMAGLAPGVQTWTLPLYGAAPAEIGLVALTDAPLSLRVLDEGGAEICADALICAFTPARNGWFRVEITHPGPGPAGYLLLSN